MAEIEMTRIKSTRRLYSLIAVTVICGALLGANPANAATKSITCYKGIASKIVKAATPKCPTGWTTKKPVVKKTTAPTSSTSKAPRLTPLTPEKLRCFGLIQASVLHQ